MLTHSYFHVHVLQQLGPISCLPQSVGELGYAISLWSASAGYLALILTESAKVDESSLGTLGQHLFRISSAT